MLVTCKICGKKIERDTAYKITKINQSTNKKINTYFCSEEEWKAEEERKARDKEAKNNVYYLICDMFGYEIQNSKFFDEWVKWNKLKSNEDIYKYLRENEDKLQQACDRTYGRDEYARIMYFSTILKNSLRDFKPKVAEQPKQTTIVNDTFAIYVPQERNVENNRTILEDVEDDLI